MRKLGVEFWGHFRASGAPTTAALPVLGKKKPEHTDGNHEDCPRCNVFELVQTRRDIAVEQEFVP